MDLFPNNRRRREENYTCADVTLTKKNQINETGEKHFHAALEKKGETSLSEDGRKRDSDFRRSMGGR